jgi:hypothetical protein
VNLELAYTDMRIYNVLVWGGCISNWCPSVILITVLYKFW